MHFLLAVWLSTSVSNAAVGLQAARCVRPTTNVAGWSILETSRLPAWRLSLPWEFKRDAAEASFDQNNPGKAHGSRWHSSDSQLSILRIDSGEYAFTLPEASDTLPEYSRCVEPIAGGEAIIVSYNKLTSVGEAYAGPFLVLVDLKTSRGEHFQMYASARHRPAFEQMLAAVRTFRRNPR